MTRVDVAALALRIAGLFTWMNAFSAIAALGDVLGGHWPALRGDPRSYCVGVLLQVIFGALLYFGAPTWARRVFRDRDEARTLSPVPAGAIAFLVSGLAYVAHAINTIPHVVEPSENAATRWAPSAIFACAAMFVIGAWLIVAREAFARRLFVDRSASDAARLEPAQRVAIAAVGLWIAGESLPFVLRELGERLLHGDQELPLHWRVEDWVGIGRVILGIALVVGCRAVSAALTNFQRPSLRPRAPDLTARDG